MSEIEGFVVLSRENKIKQINSFEAEFIVDESIVLRREKARPENQLEPDINEIQRFIKREL